MSMTTRIQIVRGASARVAAADSDIAGGQSQPPSQQNASQDRPAYSSIFGERSYWRRRYEQWIRDGEEDAESDQRTTSFSMRRKPFAPGTIAVLPLTMQVAFRRKMLSIFAVQLLLLTMLTAVFTYDKTLKTFTHDTFQGPADMTPPLLGSIAALAALYRLRMHFPLNWVMVTLFTAVLSLFVASVQSYLDTPAGLFCCGFTFVAVCIMVLLSGLTVRYPPGTSPSDQPDANAVETISRQEEASDQSDVGLRSPLFAGLVAFAVTAVGSGLWFLLLDVSGYTDEENFVTLRALIYSLLLELVLLSWFSYDASSMYSVLTPDEYMSGVVYFYVDLIVLACASSMLAGVLLISAMVCPTTGFGYFNCHGCLCMRRGRDDEEEVYERAEAVAGGAVVVAAPATIEAQA